MNLLLLVALAGGASGAAAAGLSQGSAAVPRTYVDSAEAQVFIYGGGTFTASTRADEITWYVGAGGVGRRLTPILFERISPTVFAIRGVGTTRVSALGLNRAPFGLIYGSDAITNGNFTWGFVNSSVAADGVQSSATTGAVDFDYSLSGQGLGGAGSTNTWHFTPSTFGPGAVLSLGFSFGIGGGADALLDAGEVRAYSAYMTAVPAATTLSAAPARVELWATAGSVSPYHVPVRVNASASFSVSADRPWIELSSATGVSGSSSVTVGARATSLAPGMYAGHVTVSANEAATVVAVTLHVANPQGALQDLTTDLTTQRALSIASADFNHDGRADFAVTNDVSGSGGERLQVLMSTPSGAFISQVFAASGQGLDIEAGDFNGDGWADIAAVAWGVNSVDVLMNDSAGSFIRSSAPLGQGVNGYDLAVGDVDADGKDDLIVATFDAHALVWLKSTGNGFSAGQSIGTCNRAQFVAVGDFNGDRHLDAAGLCEGDHTIRVYLGNGSGTFTAAAAGPMAATGLSGLAVADLDGDGLQDLFAGGAYSAARVFLGDATAGIRDSNHVLPAAPGVIGDLDGDGYPDLVFRDGAAAIVYGGGAGGSLNLRGYFGSTFYVFDLVVADVDGDGANDLVGVWPPSDTLKVLGAAPVETTSTLTPPASAVFASPMAFTLTVTAAGVNGAIVPQGTAQLFLCDASFACETPASAAVAGAGTFALPVNILLSRGYYYFTARFTPGSAATQASGTNPVGLAVQQADSTLTLSELSERPLGGVPFTMTATVSPSQATGVVRFYDAAHGTLLGTASLVNGVATATLPGLPANLFYTFQAVYDGDYNVRDSSSGYVDVQIGPAPTVSLSLVGLDQEWTGVANPVIVIKPSDLPVTVTYNGSGVVPVDLGDYAVEARSSDPARPAVVTGTLRIRPNRNVTIDIPALTVTYDGQPHSSTVTTSPAGLAVVVKYRNLANGSESAAPPVEPGTYFQIADVDDPRGTQLYQGIGAITIEKKLATVTLSDMVQTFVPGQLLRPTVATAPDGLPVVMTYNGLPNTQGLGSYQFVATIDDPHWQGSASGTFVIQAPAFTITNTTQTFDGTPKSVTVTPAVAGTPFVVSYNGSLVSPINAGTYAVEATSADPARPGSASATLTIQKGAGSFSVANTAQVYSGAPRPISVTTVPAGLQYAVSYNGSATPPVNSGTYSFTVTVTDQNVTAVTPQSGTLTVAKAPATVVIGNLTQGDTGLSHPVTVTTTPAGLPTTVTYNGLPAPPTAAGDYAVVATVNDANYAGTATATLSVLPRAATTLAVEYNGAFLPRSGPGVQTPNLPYGASTVIVRVSGGATPITGRIQVRDVFNNATSTVIYDSLTAVTAPVSFTVTLPVGLHQFLVGYQGDDLHQGANLTTIFNVVRATPSITPDFSALTRTFDGQPKSVPFTVLPAGSSYTVTYDGSTTPPTDAGTYRVQLRTTDPNVVPTTASYTLTINRMVATVSLSGLTQVADGDPKSVTVTSSPLLPSGYTFDVTYDGRSNPPTRIGSYRVTASNRNITGTATGTLTLVAPITITGGPFVYDGRPKQATVTFSDPITRLRSVVYANETYNSEAPPTNAGTYTVSAIGCGGGNGCNNVVTGTIVIAKAQVSLGIDSLSNGTTGDPVPVVVTWTPSSIQAVPLVVTYNGSTTPPTNAGTYNVVVTLNSPNFVPQTYNATYFVTPWRTQMSLTSRVVNWTGAPQALQAAIRPTNAPYTVTYQKAGGFPSTTPPSEAGLYTVTMAATGGYAGSLTATLDIRGFLTLSSDDSSRPFTFTVDGSAFPANSARVVTSQPHTVIAEGRQVSALERYTFGSWRYNGGVSFENAAAMPTTLSSLGNAFLTAVAKREFAVITDVASGSGTVTGDGWYDGTSRVRLTATPAAGYLFDRFVIEGRDVTENGYMLSMANAGHRVRVHFVRASTITGMASPSVGGSVSGGGVYPIDSTQTLTATPAAGFRFAGWRVTGGSVVGGRLADVTSPAQVRITSTSVTVTAMFEPVLAINYVNARWAPGVMWVNVTVTNTSSIPVAGVRVSDVTDNSRFLRLQEVDPADLGTLAPGQSAELWVAWLILSDLPPSSFNFTMTVTTAAGYQYSRSQQVSNY